MNLAQTIQQHVEKFPPEKQAEVLDFVLFLEQKSKLSVLPKNPAAPRCRLRDEPAIGIWQNRPDMQDSADWVRTVRRTTWQRKKAQL